MLRRSSRSRNEERHAGIRRGHARQARPDHGGGEQSLHRLGHRKSRPRARRRARLHVSGRRAEATRRAAGAGARGPRRRPLRRHRAGDHRRRIRGGLHPVGLARFRGARAGRCAVPEAATIDAAFAAVSTLWGSLDFVVHAMAFSDRGELDGRYVDTTQDNFTRTILISCYSLTAVAQRAEKLMPKGGALLTLSYYGAEKWMPHYNVMGVAKAGLEASVRYLAADLGSKNIRVNAISAGPIKTLAASGIGDFRYILKWNEYNAPLRRNVSGEEVGDAAVYLLSDMSRGVTGEIHHAHAGHHTLGMKRPDAPDISLAKD